MKTNIRQPNQRNGSNDNDRFLSKHIRDTDMEAYTKQTKKRKQQKRKK